MNQTLLFDVEAHGLSEVEKISSRIRSTHTVGGTLAEYGYSISGASGHVHLLYRFDQEDDLVPTLLPHCRWVPLVFGFYCCKPESGDLLTAYRVASESEIQLLSPKGQWSEEVELYSGYPPSFPLQRVRIKKLKHDPDDLHCALKYSAVFGLAHLSTDDYQNALELVRPRHAELYRQGETDLGLEQFLSENSEPFMQGCPDNSCIWEDCKFYGKNYMKTFASIEGHPTAQMQLWSDTDDDPMNQLVFRQCLGCRTIYVTSQGY